jgi:hypothetical protein
MDSDLLGAARALFIYWTEKEQQGTLHLDKEKVEWEINGQIIELQQTQQPIKQHYQDLQSTDDKKRLTAYYELGRELESEGPPLARNTPRWRKFSVFTTKAARRTFKFFSQCGRERLGVNPGINATLLGRCSSARFEELLYAERCAGLFAGAQIEGGNDLLGEFSGNFPF